MAVLKVLHLIGSAESEFFRELSFAYAGDCLQATHDPTRYETLIACVTPDRQWRLTDQFDRSLVQNVPAISMAEATRQITAWGPDVALPQMFCMDGMTTYRSLLRLLEIPFVGNLPETMSLTADKANTRSVVASHGVIVPEAEVLRSGQSPTIGCPAVVKPATADNSVGVSLVRHPDQYTEAIARASEHCERVLVERFIPAGREVRCGVIDTGGNLQCLPLQEYTLDPETPIRGYQCKLTTNDRGEVDLASKYYRRAWIVDPADDVVQDVWEVAQRCHLALGCRDYGLFDFRIDPDGQPYFLEAGLYCSFAPGSILTSMVAATGTSLDSFLQDMLSHAIDRDVVQTDPSIFASNS